ncbi:phenylacetate-CoA oxygenase complex, PaaJ subunit [Psychroflexus torquis ATCC 700755]|uniref:Phenylacetate-CoA oxygenase complex, PaaJ subunit n=1 Tax=Psychroflexus torquis (strain ATCC 700755 / CIP 106069 / ACAM 623) TaxID=313595 RepID=K4IB06_PSYTT|nr:1,2-phenylacetyl-CoA epoxidase subunit PaaD [Psychroflexus torquis]AFU67797.1 phenylacetate-CoA oxygenase complex, PaaJ subunit [Psychroflexus torquis ATCC 700755]
MTEDVYIEAELFSILKSVPDPEIPVLSIIDLGVVRSAYLKGENVFVEITPTYSGCPAMDVIGDDIKTELKKHGYIPKVKLILSPAWTTDWMTDEGKQALRDYGIAPPMDATSDKEALLGNKRVISCPQCESKNTRLVSQFGSTACKAMFKCEDCEETFDYFKCLT